MTTDAVLDLRLWLTDFYRDLVEDAKSKDDLDMIDDYGAYHWMNTNLKELCEELHQIIFDYGRDELISIIKFFMKISGKRRANEVFEMFSKTVEHSH